MVILMKINTYVGLKALNKSHIQPLKSIIAFFKSKGTYN